MHYSTFILIVMFTYESVCCIHYQIKRGDLGNSFGHSRPSRSRLEKDNLPYYSLDKPLPRVMCNNKLYGGVD